MTKEDYFKNHLEHRVKLLVTFRNRFSDSQLESYLCKDLYNDLYCCSKDISIMMVRFFLEELGVKLSKKTSEISQRVESKGNKNEYSEWKKRVENNNLLPLTTDDITKDPRVSHIKRVLEASNRAVAHLDEKDVNHFVEETVLLEAINFTAEKIKENMYKNSGFSVPSILLEGEKVNKTA